MKIEITHRITGTTLFSLECASVKLAVEAAVSGDADLSGADLSGADLSGANLSGANLGGADLSGADLSGANLGGANLGGADLRGANLGGANLGGANLRGAYLRGADLRGANLGGAYLGGAYLRGAKGIETFPISIMCHRHAMWTTQDGRLQIGCEVHTFEEWRELAESLGAKNDYSSLDVEIYKLHIEHCARVAQLLWNKGKETAE